MTLLEMAQEYRVNIKALELRLAFLQQAQRQTQQREVGYRLKQRCGCLRMLINESRKAVHEMEHYHDREGESYENKRAV